jgi:hypothetical protein
LGTEMKFNFDGDPLRWSRRILRVNSHIFTCETDKFSRRMHQFPWVKSHMLMAKLLIFHGSNPPRSDAPPAISQVLAVDSSSFQLPSRWIRVRFWGTPSDFWGTPSEIMVNKGNHPQMALIQVSEIF